MRLRVVPATALAAAMSRKSTGGFRRRSRVADKMTPHLLDCVDRMVSAERAGDFEVALEWQRSVPMFSRGRHRQLLEALVVWGDEVPPWVGARTIAYLATRCEDGTTGTMLKEMLMAIGETVHGDLLTQCWDDQGDPIRVTSAVMGESWAFHQLALYEAGVLAAFVAEFVEGRLAEYADLARSWAAAPMRGYEIGHSLPGARLQVREPGAVTWTEVLDLGARSCAKESGWVLGRLVPSGIGDQLMFDVPPLGMPEDLARAVSAAERGPRWFRPLTTALETRRITSEVFLREDYELATDVQELDLLDYGTPIGDRQRVRDQLRSGRDEVSRAAFRVLRKAVEGDLPAEDQAYVAAAAMNVRASDDVRRLLVRPGQPQPWEQWADRTPEPARSRLLALAQAARGPASSSWKRAG